MRLDKFLKISRIIKRRSVAKEVADKGRIQINGKLAKSSSTVKIGDVLTPMRWPRPLTAGPRMSGANLTARAPRHMGQPTLGRARPGAGMFSFYF